MTKAEKLPAILAATFVVICVIAALISSPLGITSERYADISEIMTGGDGESEDELITGDTVNVNTAAPEELCLFPGIGEKTAEEIRIYVEVEDDVP